MKFDPTKFRLPGLIRKLRQSKQMKYVLLAFAFAALIAGAVLTYGLLAGHYDERIPPSASSEQATKRKSGAEAANEKENAETGAEKNPENSSSEGEAASDPENPTGNETEKVPGATGGGSGETKKSPTLPEKAKTPAEKPNGTAAPAETAKPETGTENTEPPVADPPETSSPEAAPPAADDPEKNTAPDFTALDANGRKIRLSENFGKPIVLNFWATWCPPCKRELPDFDKLYGEYGDRVVFMMVNLTDGGRDTVEGTKNFISKNRYTFPVYFDTEYRGADAYNVSAIPQTTFIDANGNVYATRIGTMNETTLRSYIDAMLGG